MKGNNTMELNETTMIEGAGESNYWREEVKRLEAENERVREALKELMSEAVILSEYYLEAFKDWPDDATIQGWDKARWKRALAAAKKARQALNAEKNADEHSNEH